MTDEEYDLEDFEEDTAFPSEDDNLELCDSCGRMNVCEHLDGFGRTRILCLECLGDIFGE